MTNQEIKTVGQTIAAETQIGGNTAERVGGVIEGIGEALDNKDAAVGYYLATMSGSTIYINASSYRLGTGGNLRAKMPAAATTACTLTVGNANAVPLWYNGAAVSADNSWEAGEIVTIFYDGTRFMTSNSQGGGGQFGSGEKIKDILLSQALGDGTGTITSQKGVSDAIFNEIDISSIDSLKTLNDALAPSSSLKPTYYTVTATLSNVKLKVGSMAVISDNMRHVVTEIMATHYTLDDTGTLTNEHSDAEIFFIYRSVKLSGGTLPDPAGTWTKWRYVNSSVWSTAAEKIKYDNSQSGLAAENVQEALDELANGIGVSPNYTPNQTLDIDDRDVYPRTAAVCTANKWVTNGKSSCIFISIGNAESIRITANSSDNAAVGFVTKKYEPGDTSPSWANGWVQALRITANTYSDLSVPEDAEYLYVGLKAASGTILKPASIVINDVKSINDRLNALADKDEELVGDINDINDELYEQSPAVIYTASQVLNLSEYAQKRGLVGAANFWQIAETGLHSHIMIPVVNATQFSISANTSYNASYAWLTEDEVAIAGVTPRFAEGETGRRTVDAGTSGNTLPTPPPSNAMYLLINAKNGTGGDLLPINVTVVSIDPNYVPPRSVSRITKCEESIAGNLDKINALHGEYEAEDGDMNLNILVDGKDNNTNSYWYYPAIMSSIFRHKRIYYGFADDKGGSGVGCINAFDHRCWKTVLKKKLTQGTVDGVSGLYPDTHNIVCVQMLPDRRLISCYSEGHGDTPYLCIRISKNKEDITEWEDVIRLNMGKNSTYAQYHYINGKHYIFARLQPSGGNPCDWAYVYSTDLETWSEPHTFLHQTNGYQYYIWLKPITDRPNMLRFAMYSNPTYNDMNIRCGIIDFENDIIYDYDGTTQVGTLTGATINSSAFTILVNQPSGSFATADKQRLHDLAVTPFDSFKIAYSITHTPFIGTYRVYNYRNGSGAVKVLCSTGEVALNNNTTARNKGNAIGLNFINPDKLFIGRSSEDSTGNDFLQIWEESEGVWTETKTVYSEAKGTEHLRNIYPIVDCNGRYAIWMRGYYNLDTYLGAETDFIVYDIENDVVF